MTAITKKLATLVAMAGKLEELAEDKMAPREMNTARKVKFAMSARRDGEEALRAAEFIHAYADRLAEGTLPDVLAGWKPTKVAFLKMAGKVGRHVDNGYHGYMVDGDEWRDKSAEAEAVRSLAVKDPAAEAERARARKLAELEVSLRNVNVPGFFPTPPAVVEMIIDRLDVEPGLTYLEPGAGKGDLIVALKAAGAESVDYAEIVPVLVRYLETSGHGEPVASDFLELTGKTYDRIAMNPPFEKGADITHVRHAFELLAPGGRLVSVMSAGAFYRSDKKATAFREWLEELGGEVEELPADAFKTAFRSTGVSTRLVTIDKEPAAVVEPVKAPPAGWLFDVEEFYPEADPGYLLAV